MTRVQIPAYHDMWMKGDRFGDVVKVVPAKPTLRAALLTQDPRRYKRGDLEIAHVLLDKSGKIAKVVYSDCEVL